jgi:hypothetical protein
MRVLEQLDALFIFSLFGHYTSTCFRLANCPSSGGKNVCMKQLVFVVRFSLLSAGLVETRPADSQLKYTTHTSFYIYTFLPPDDRQLASPKYVNELKIKSASSWFHYTQLCAVLFV